MTKLKPWQIGLGILVVAVTLITLFVYLNLLGRIAMFTFIFTFLFAIWDKFGSTWIIMSLAHKDVWWSPYRMLPDPGHINIMTWGLDKPGPFSMVLAGHIPEWHYHRRNKRFYKEGTPAYRKAFPKGPPKPRGKAAGMKVVWVGFFKLYYRRKREWIAMELVGDEHKMKKKSTTSENDYIFYFSTAMALRIKQISRVTAGSLAPAPVVLDLSFNSLLINPEKAEFIAGKWEEKVAGALQSRARIYISNKTVDELRAEKDDESLNDLVDELLRANYKSSGGKKGATATVGLIDEFGVKVEALFYEDFQMEEGDKEIFAAQKRVSIAALAVDESKLFIESEKNKGTAAKERAKEEAIGKQATADVYASNPIAALALESKLTTLVMGRDIPIAITPTPPATPTPPSP